MSLLHRNKLGAIFWILSMLSPSASHHQFREPEAANIVISSGNEKWIKFCIWIGRISSMMHAFIRWGLFFLQNFHRDTELTLLCSLCTMNSTVNIRDNSWESFLYYFHVYTLLFWQHFVTLGAFGSIYKCFILTSYCHCEFHCSIFVCDYKHIPSFSLQKFSMVTVNH